MNTKIKLLSATAIALAGFFLGANLASAQNTTITTCTTAVVNGTITSTSGVQTSAWFEWGTSYAVVDSGTGTDTPTQVFNNPQDFSQMISGLNPSTTYYYRAIVSNIYGSAQGGTLSFSTPACPVPAPVVTLPAVTTSGANSMSQNSATLNGYVAPNGANTNAWFEWGTSASFGNTTSSVSYGTGATSFSNSISGLSPNTPYYYRAVAQNAQGTVYGNTMSFTTNDTTIVQAQATVSTQSATSIAPDYATLNGYVNPNGTNDTTRWFEWGTNSYAGNQNQTTHYTQGNRGAVSSGISGLTQNTTYYYRAVAQNSQGTVYGNTMSFTTNDTTIVQAQATVSTQSATSIAPDYATLNGYVNPNGTNDTTRWFEWGGSQSLGNSTQKLSQGSVASNFSASLTGLVSNTTYYYRAVAHNSQGTFYGNTISFTTGGQTAVIVGSLPSVNTLLATELTGSTARLNGLVFTSASQSSNAWFEWGTNSSLGNKTQTINVGMLPVVKHSDSIAGLVSGQTYYYRIVAENPYGKVYGSVNTFVSKASVYAVAPTVVNPVALKPITQAVTRGSSAQALVSLSIEGGAEMIGAGEKRTYHVKWKNDSAQSLKNVVLRVTFPKSMNVDSATKGAFSSADNSVVVDLKTLTPKEDGDTFIFATSGRGLKSGELLVVTANMIYTGANGVQGDAVAYAMHRAEMTQNAISANVFGAGDFVPTTLFGWVVLMTLVLVLVLLGNHLYGRFSDEKH